MTLNEMLEYGPIVAHDEELGLYVTVNGSYLNLWRTALVSRSGEQEFENIDCRSRYFEGKRTTWLQHSVLQVQQWAEEWLEEIRNKS